MVPRPFRCNHGNAVLVVVLPSRHLSSQISKEINATSILKVVNAECSGYWLVLVCSVRVGHHQRSRAGVRREVLGPERDGGPQRAGVRGDPAVAPRGGEVGVPGEELRPAAGAGGPHAAPHLVERDRGRRCDVTVHSGS